MKCRICHCTQERACPAGCGWAAEKGPDVDICTVCAAFRAEMDEYVSQANRVTGASLARLLKECQLGVRGRR